MDFIGNADFGTEKLNPLYDAVTSSSINISFIANVFGCEKYASTHRFQIALPLPLKEDRRTSS